MENILGWFCGEYGSCSWVMVSLRGFGSLNLVWAICIHVVEGFVILMQSVSSPADIPRRSLMATAT